MRVVARPDRRWTVVSKRPTSGRHRDWETRSSRVSPDAALAAWEAHGALPPRRNLRNKRRRGPEPCKLLGSQNRGKSKPWHPRSCTTWPGACSWPPPCSGPSSGHSCSASPAPPSSASSSAGSRTERELRRPGAARGGPGRRLGRGQLRPLLRRRRHGPHPLPEARLPALCPRLPVRLHQPVRRVPARPVAADGLAGGGAGSGRRPGLHRRALADRPGGLACGVVGGGSRPPGEGAWPARGPARSR